MARRKRKTITGSMRSILWTTTTAPLALTLGPVLYAGAVAAGAGKKKKRKRKY